MRNVKLVTNALRIALEIVGLALFVGNLLLQFTYKNIFVLMRFCFLYGIIAIKTAGVSVFLLPQSGGDAMTVYEGLSLMIAFATLVVLIISVNRK